MSLRAKLTLGSVALATILVTIITAVGFGNLMRFQFRDTLARAELIQSAATEAVIATLNRYDDWKRAVNDPELNAQLLKLASAYKGILEISLVSADGNELILASTLGEKRAGTIVYPRYPDFTPLAGGGLLQQVRALFPGEPQSYKLDKEVGPGNVPLLYVRVLVNPTLIRDDLTPSFRQNLDIALITIAAAVLITFLASAVAFRPLSRISRMLDLVARGEYEAEKAAPADRGGDEFAVIASKVGLLGQRLRGAQDEASGLRGNIDRLLADLEEAVFLFDPDRRLIFASGSVGKFLSGDRAGLAGKPLNELFPPSETMGDLLDHAVTTGNAIRNRRVPYRFPPVVMLSLDMLDRSGFLVRLRDPEAQRQLNRQLQTADRLAAISRISGGVAHEVKNPLNAILLHVEVARAKVARGENDVSPEMDIIASEILRLDRVVRTFLDFSRPVELKLVNIQVHDLVNQIVDLARPQATAGGIQVEVRQEAEGTEVRVDLDLMKQAVLNVVVNAMQAMPGGGRLGFESCVKADTAEIRVSDTGTGISPELRDKIFRLYFSTKTKGSGIGLAMTFRIVQLHDGTIDFTSEPGKGTTFLIRLPIAV
ncbi:MAG TPA: ATP-binding protein [Candidatus Acidoferrales bacterium]|nr:ATP-binding protein [Candidatus Acidoferrales bacterium]